MKLTINYSVKFRAFGVTLGTVKGTFNDNIPVLQNGIEQIVESAALSKIGLVSGWTKTYSSNGITLIVSLT